MNLSRRIRAEPRRLERLVRTHTVEAATPPTAGRDAHEIEGGQLGLEPGALRPRGGRRALRSQVRVSQPLDCMPISAAASAAAAASTAAAEQRAPPEPRRVAGVIAQMELHLVRVRARWLGLGG